MTTDIISILSKIDQFPFGIRQKDGSWRLVGNLDESQNLFIAVEKLILVSLNKKDKLYQKNIDWSKLISYNIANYIRKHHPNLKLIDVSVSRGFTLFSQIQAQNIDSNYWKGGNAGSVQFLFEEAKYKTIAEIIERTALSFIDEIIWASAVAPNLELAEFHAKLESIERWVTMQWWQQDPNFKISENVIPYLCEEQKQLVDAVLFEWEPYNANVRCFKIFNPFNVEVALAIVEAFIDGKQWTFYGNGLSSNLTEAAKKACLETLQFVPGSCSSVLTDLERNMNENNHRIHSWSIYSKDHQISDFCRINQECFNSVSDYETFFQKIDCVFKRIGLRSQVIELQDCPNIFVSYVTSSLDWRKEQGIPIV